MPLKFVQFMIFAALYVSCNKNDSGVRYSALPIPNGDFENWNALPIPDDWHTNSCPLCVPPYETYIVQKATDAEHGQFAAKFVYNNVYKSFAEIKFPISVHPNLLTAYTKSNIGPGDTATIHVELFAGRNIVDQGIYYETASSSLYKKVQIPITQTTQAVDSAFIRIEGGKIQQTEFSVDNLQFQKTQ